MIMKDGGLLILCLVGTQLGLEGVLTGEGEDLLPIPNACGYDIELM